MLFRSLLSFLLVPLALSSAAQATVVQQGKPFSKVLKGGQGDIYTVVEGLFAKDGRHVLYVEEGLTPKVVRLDALLQPTDEFVLKDVLIDGLKWTGAAPIAMDGSLYCLLVSNGKKAAEYGIGKVETAGPLAITGFRKLASFEWPYINDPSHTMAARPLPDPILFTKGLAYAQQERIVRTGDGHYLLNHFTHMGKGNKRFFFAYMDKDLDVLWSGNAELPYLDEHSSIHQIVVGNDGLIRLLVYLFNCKGDEGMADKNCHELHLTTISENGKTVSDVLLDKDFVSSARIVDRGEGKVSLAIRYGSLTGQPGTVLTFDPTDPKLKPTPLVAQRLPSIRKAKLMAYGDPTADPRKPPSRTAKVPDEIVDLVVAKDGGLRVVETFLESQFALPMGDAIAIRHLSGSVRVSQVLPNDSIGWQKVIERALMTTAGQAYEGSAAIALNDELLLFHGHTPKGYEAILRAGTEAGGGKDDRPAEPQVLKAVRLGADGSIVAEGTAMMMEEAFVPCPMGVLLEANGTLALVKSYDRGTQYKFTVVDLAKLGQ